MDHKSLLERAHDWGPGTKPANQEYLDSVEKLRYAASETYRRVGEGHGVLNVETTCDEIARVISMSAITIAAGVGKEFAARDLRALADLIDPPTNKEVAQLSTTTK